MKKLLFLLTFLLAVCVLSAQIQTITLNGFASTDADGHIVKWRWAQVGTTPSICVIAQPDSMITTIVPAGGAQWKVGTYSFQLTVTDNGGATASDIVNINVLPNPDKPPVISAGPDKQIQLPTSALVLTGSASDPDGTIASVQWSQIAGPNTAVFNRKDSTVVTISGLIAGSYSFRFKGTDNIGASAADTVLVTVLAANVVPRADAGPDQSVTLPLQVVALGGIDSPPGATIAWVKLRGPSGGTIVNPTASFTKVIDLPVGSYVFQKSVSADGMTARDIVNVTVKKRCTWWQSLWGCKG